MTGRVVDIAGVAVQLLAHDAERAELLATSVAGFTDTNAAPVATLTVDDERIAVPARPAHSELLGTRFWHERDGMVVAAGDVVVRADGASADAHLPDLADGYFLEGCVGLAITWLVAAHDRFVLHGAAVTRDDRALLLLGHTGAGKSTLTVAALEAGWEALADDQVLIDGSDGHRDVYGFHRSPAVPLEIGGRFADEGVKLGDPRARAQLSPAVLTAGGTRLAGTIVIAHADDHDGSLRRVSGLAVLPLLLQSFAGCVDPSLRERFFPVAAAVSRLPAWELGLAADPSIRRARAAHHLDLCDTALVNPTV